MKRAEHARSADVEVQVVEIIVVKIVGSSFKNGFTAAAKICLFLLLESLIIDFFAGIVNRSGLSLKNFCQTVFNCFLAASAARFFKISDLII